jgi:hypothetical protein
VLTRPENYRSTFFAIAGWPVHLISYKLGDSWLCKVDNVSPGAQIARSSAKTQAEAERLALEKAERRLSATRRTSGE